MIEVDGSIMEGGGQVLRVSVALSAVTKTPIRVINIRAKRQTPGLRAQHLKAVESIARLVNAKTEGLNLGSREITFIPGPIEARNLEVDVGTAGSTSLILQTMMPAMAFATDFTSTTIKGGTNNPMAPPIDFLQMVLFPTLGKMGVHASVELIRRGFYPRGQGTVKMSMTPLTTVLPITLTEFGKVNRISGLAYSSRLPPHVVERMVSTTKSLLLKAGYGDLLIGQEILQPNDPRCAANPGCGMILFAELSSGGIISGDTLGALGKPAEKVGEEATQALVEQLRAHAPMDKHVEDQLVIWMALAKGTSVTRVSELTLHSMTCIRVVQNLVNAEFDVEGEIGKSATITCHGIGFQKDAS
jgi:RNA 3'-terminal phosphate cyclase (ATP)